MHPSIQCRISAPLTAVRPVLSAYLGAILLVSIAAAAEGTKTYTLFEGDNIAVGQGNEVYPVRDVSGGSWVVLIDGKEVPVSAKSGPIAMKMTPLQKFSDVSVTLANLKTERAYTYKNDPSVRLTRAMGQAAQMNAGYQAAVNQASAAQTANINVSSSSNSSNPAATANATRATGAPDQGLRVASSGAGTDLRILGANDIEGEFDALDVAFEVSSPTPLSRPYIVTTARIHEPGAPAGSFRNVVFAKALEPVNATVTKVEFQQADFPFGYLLEGYEIHVYDHGREVASNLAPKRQVLTLDQAFDFVRTKYLEAHQTGTFPAVPVMGELPPDYPAAVATGMFETPVFVKVSKDGLATEVFSDSACTARIDDPFVNTVVRSIRFQPAIDAGKPVDGVVTLQLNKLRM